MSLKFGIPIAAACLFAAAPAAAQDWALDIQPAECTLNRAVMEPAPLLVGIYTLPGSDAYTFVMANRDVPEIGTKSVPATIVFAAGTPGFTGQVAAFPVRKEAGAGIVISALGTDFLDGFAKATTISVTIGSKTYGPYPLPRAGGAARAFKRCISDQLVEWGADPAQFLAGGKTPVPLSPPRSWISRRDLTAMAGPGDSFNATFRLSVSPEGVIDGCEIVSEKPDKRAEKLGCAVVLTKKLYTPASDPQGKPVRGAVAFEIGLVRRANQFR